MGEPAAVSVSAPPPPPPPPPRGITLRGVRRFAADLAAESAGAFPGLGVGVRRPHAHALVERATSSRGCAVCGATDRDGDLDRDHDSVLTEVSDSDSEGTASVIDEPELGAVRAPLHVAGRRLHAAATRKRRLRGAAGDGVREPEARAWRSCNECVYDECRTCVAEGVANAGKLPQLTTLEVCRLAETHLTAARRCAYIDLLGDDPLLVGAESNAFVVHTWSASFDSLAESLAELDGRMRARAPDIVPCFYVDLLVVNQFERDDLSLQSTLPTAIQRVGHTALALAWPSRQALASLECLFELSLALAVPAAGPRPHAPFEVAMPVTSRTAFEKALRRDFGALTETLCAVDVRHAELASGGPDFKVLVLEAVAAIGGADAMSRRVAAGLRNWLVSVAQEALASAPLGDERATSSLRLALARVLSDVASSDEAVPLLREAFETKRRTLGMMNPSTLASVGDLASVLLEKGEVESAEPLAVEALEAVRRSLGSQHEATLGLILNLVSLLQQQGKLKEAEPLLREALETSRSLRGDDNAKTVKLMVELASLLQSLRNLSEAETLLREALAIKCRTLGEPEASPSTLTTLCDLASLLQRQGRPKAAVPLLCTALAAKRATLGNAHVATETAVLELATLLQRLGELAEAEPLSREALANLRVSRGDAHRETLAALVNHAFILRSLGRLEEAEKLMREDLLLSRRTFGDGPTTLASIANLTSLLKAEGKLVDVEDMMREAFVTRQRALGTRHLETVKSMKDLAGFLHEQGKLGLDELTEIDMASEALASGREYVDSSHDYVAVSSGSRCCSVS